VQLEGHASTCFGCLNLSSGHTLVPESNIIGDEALAHSILSWAADGTICLWDLHNLEGICKTPSANWVIPDYPIYSCALGPSWNLICAGGTSSSKSFMGTPIHLLDLAPALRNLNI
jgi:WD40 repeat protein